MFNRRPAQIEVGDLIDDGRYCVTSVRNPGADVGVVVSAIDDQGRPAILRRNGTDWVPEA